MNIKRFFPVVVCALFAGSAFVQAVDWDNLNREDYEEPAGGSFALLANPQDNIYGFTFGDGTWLKNTPVFGDFFLGFFSSRKEDTWYSSVGMTIRLMPHWCFAPFAGGGGSYNYSLLQASENTSTPQEPEKSKDQGDSYWGGHAEAGFRVCSPEGRLLFEAMGRYTWTSLEDNRSYWLAGISVGAGFGN